MRAPCRPWTSCLCTAELEPLANSRASCHERAASRRRLRATPLVTDTQVIDPRPARSVLRAAVRRGLERLAPSPPPRDACFAMPLRASARYVPLHASRAPLLDTDLRPRADPRISVRSAVVQPINTASPRSRELLELGAAYPRADSTTRAPFELPHASRRVGPRRQVPLHHLVDVRSTRCDHPLVVAAGTRPSGSSISTRCRPRACTLAPLLGPPPATSTPVPLHHESASGAIHQLAVDRHLIPTASDRAS